MNEIDALLMQWIEAQKTLKSVKAAEAEMRKKVVEAFCSEDRTEGSKVFELGNGYKLKTTIKMNYSVDDSKVDECLDILETYGREGKEVAATIVKFKPELCISKYKKLSDVFKNIMDECVTIKPGMPTLEFIEAKKDEY